jgi:hypothetical protein
MLNNEDNQKDWFALATQLRAQNTDLIKTIVNLENVLSEKQKICELTINEQSSEITKLQDKITFFQSQIDELNVRLIREQHFNLELKVRLTTNKKYIESQNTLLSSEFTISKLDKNPKKSNNFDKSKKIVLPFFLLHED